MKEVKEARKQQEKLLERIEAQIAYYDDILRFETGGDTTEKKTMTFQRDIPEYRFPYLHGKHTA